VTVSELQLLPLEPIDNPLKISFEVEEYSSNIELVQEQRAQDIKVRKRLLYFSILLTVCAPFTSFYFPGAWTYILATGVAFTIGTNLLISVVSTGVEDKANRVEERMVELLDSLNAAAESLQVFHEQIESVNIPGVQSMIENVRDEVAPGLRSLDDVDIAQIAFEIRRASRFIDTLDMDKVAVYLSHIKKEEEEEEEGHDYWEGDYTEDEYDFDDKPSISEVAASQAIERKTRENAILSRLIG
jgi:hypothetical protein